MSTNVVNLDALIPREDFEVISTEESQGLPPSSIQIRNLERNDFFYNVLRKPDFQRETSSWSPTKICDFVRTFLSEDLIPAIILWRSGKNVFVIDGSHRLSALIAWVHDDYGAGSVSRGFFQNFVPPEQKKAAERTKRQIDREIGTYEEHKRAVEYPDQSRPEVAARAKRMGAIGIQLQWVTGNATKAEASFFKINQAATPIDKTELRILRARVKPNALSARVITHNATGHKYWRKFSETRQAEIEGLGRNIYETLFIPPLNTPIKTLDIPIGGRGYGAQSLPLIFELVNLANDVKIIDPTKSNKLQEDQPADDPDGAKTVEFLKNTRRVAFRMSGVHPSSLGLHPAVYFYSADGRYQPTSFLAVVSLIRDFEGSDRFKQFTQYRRRFEDFLLGHKNLPNEVTVKWGSGVKGFEKLKELYLLVLNDLENDKTEKMILADLRRHPTFGFLATADDRGDKKRSRGKDFSDETKSATFLSSALENPVRCKICECLIHVNSMTVDHIDRKREGGTASQENAQLAHPFCNSTVKN